MQTGAITGYFDVAQIALYGFWVFFAGVVFYIRREDKREGYPLDADRPNARTVTEGFPPTPYAKHFNLGHGIVHEMRAAERPVAATPTNPWPGAPLQPTGNPMIDAVGPASYAMRSDLPDLTYDERSPKIVPLRVATDFFLAPEDPDPRGMPVVAADNRVAGHIVDVWVDRSETVIRYLEAEVPTDAGPRRVLIPMNLSKVVDGIRPQVRVRSITAAQFADVPTLRNPDQVTLLEEDMVVGYYGGGTLYATPFRMGPLV